MNPFISPAVRNTVTKLFYKDGFGIKYLTMIDMLLKINTKKEQRKELNPIFEYVSCLLYINLKHNFSRLISFDSINQSEPRYPFLILALPPDLHNENILTFDLQTVSHLAGAESEANYAELFYIIDWVYMWIFMLEMNN